MLSRVTCAIFGIALAINVAIGETIHLKNGRTILADHVRENGTHLEYEIGDDSYAISKSLVDRVEAGGMPASASSAGGASSAASKLADLPTFAPANSLANEGDLLAKVINDGKVDTSALASLESKGNLELAATVDFIAGKFEFDHGNIGEARRYFENALRFQPDNSTILIYYSALLIR